MPYSCFFSVTAVICVVACEIIYQFTVYRGFLKWWVSPTSMGFPTKKYHVVVFWGYHHLRKRPYIYTVAMFIYRFGPKSQERGCLHPESKFLELGIVPL